MKPAFEQRNVPIVFASDANYAPHLYTAVDSLLANFSPEHHADIIVLIEKAFDDEALHAFSRLMASYPRASLRFLEIPPDVNREIYSQNVNPRFGPAASYRLFITRLLPEYERILYCDVDVVIPGDVSELFAIDMGDYCLGACLDFPRTIDDPNVPFPDAATLGLRRVDRYFNSGVLVLDLARLRREGWEARIAERVGSVYDYQYVDQDVLNIIFEDAWYPLPFRWNYQFALLFDNRLLPEEQKGLWKACACERSWGIIHFAGTKPWSTDPLIARNEAYFEWEAYALRNPLLDLTDMRRAVQASLRPMKVALFWRYVRLLLCPTKSRRRRYRRNRSQYHAFRRDARVLTEKASS